MLTNEQFLDVLQKSFKEYLNAGSSRPTAKLKPLHGSIANDLQEKFGPKYKIISQGIGNDKEEKVPGFYKDKKVDIAIKKDGRVIGAIAIKFVMQNYKQNGVNYFENMIGETANLRKANIPYYQILILPENLPYFEKSGEKTIKHKEMVSEQNLRPYIKLSNDNIVENKHAPNKILLLIVKLKGDDEIMLPGIPQKEYIHYYKDLVEKAKIFSYSIVFQSIPNCQLFVNKYSEFIELMHKELTNN